MVGRVHFISEPRPEGGEELLEAAEAFVMAIAATIKVDPDTAPRETLVANAASIAMFWIAGKVGLSHEQARSGLDAALHSLVLQGAVRPPSGGDLTETMN